MVLQPVGPLPASTYWRRRGVLLLGLLVLLLLLRSCGGSDPAPRRAVTPAPSATPTRATPSVSPRPVVTPAPTVAPVAAGLCPDTALELTATTDADVYAPGATPKITMVATNTSQAPCRRDVGSGVVELLVYSGEDRVWSSDDCNPAKASSLVTLAPAGTTAVVKTWPGVRSAPGCGGTKATAKAGTYRVVARLGTLRVSGAVFRIRG